MRSYSDLADLYISTWNETDPVERRRAVVDLFDDQASYVDPLTTASGHDEIVEAIGAVQLQFPGFAFRLLGPVDGHHRQARFRWELGQEGNEAPIAGFDTVLLETDGRIRTVLGFLDRVPSAS